jgi:hypothetical protein
MSASLESARSDTDQPTAKRSPTETDGELTGRPASCPIGIMIKMGLIVSAIVLVLIAIFGPAIRRGYLSARSKMRAATERRRLSKSHPHE